MPGLLPDRSVLAVSGADRTTFLQGLVSNDVTLARPGTCGPGTCVWSALLSPQGKWLSDFFIFSDETRLLLDVPAAHADMLATRLSRFRLRADVRIEAAELRVAAGFDDDAPPEGALHAPDPRLPGAGWRALVDTADTLDDFAAAHDLHRLTLGLPDPVDCEPDRTLLLEANFDRLHGVSFSKGCYMGQELTARTHYRGLVRRRLVPISGAHLPPVGAELFAGGKACGTMRSHREGRGLAFLRTEAFTQDVTDAEGRAVAVHVPDWLAAGKDAS